MLLLVLNFQLGPVAVYANPSGEQVVAGQADFERAGSTLTINQGTNKVIINWQDFSIQQGELTKFLQPSASSAALNRVVGGNLSQIYGTLQANGTVILINPNGITVGPSGMIDVGTFMGSTLDIGNEQFLQGGDLNFMGDSKASIQNFGKIGADDSVFLFAQKIDNQGQVIAGNEAAMAAGSNIYLRQGGSDRVSVLVGSSDQVTGDGIRNSGEVQAAMVTMKATGSAYSAAVNNEGVIRATGASKVGGRVLLTGNGGNILNSGTIAAKNANGTGGEIKLQAGSNAAKTATVVSSGTLDATGTTGGQVEVTGDRVALTEDALVDVSGVNGGGTALIGGDWQGANPGVQNAQRTYVGDNVQIKADAIESGDGGKVVVWADEVTRFSGDISARGGAAFGDGGQVEVSGKQYLNFQGTVNTTAANGATGTLLLDPDDIIIADQSASPSANDADVADGQVLFADGAGAFTINELAIEALAAGTNIILQANNTIVVNDLVTDGVVTLTNDSSITLQTTTGTISFTNADDRIQASGTGSITILAGGSALLGGLTTAGGNITVTTAEGVVTTSATQAINAGTGSVSLTAGTATAADNLLTVNVGGISGSGGITLVADNMAINGTVNSGAGITTLRQFENGTLINVGGADAANTLGLTDTEIDQVTAATLQIGDGNAGNLAVTAAITPAGAANLRLTTGGALAVNNTVNVTGNLRLTSDGGTTQTAILTANALATAGNGAVTLNLANSFNTFASSTANNVSITRAGGSLSIGTVGGITAVNLGAGNFTVNVSNGALTQANSITANDVTVTTGGGNNITLNNVNNAISGTFTATALGASADLALINTVATQLGNIEIQDSVSITSSGGPITQAAVTTLDIGGNTSFSTTLADQAITLDNSGNTIAGTVAFTTSGTGGDVTYRHAGDINFDTTTVGGDLTVLQETAGSDTITQVGGSVITVAGVASFDNNSTVTGDVAITNTTATNFGPGDSVVAGDLTITSAGPVTQTGAIKVAGDFDSNGAGSTTLDNAGNVFGGTFTTSDGSIFLSRVGDVDINVELGGAVNTGASGNLTVIALLEGEEFAGGSNLPGASITLNGSNAFSGGLVVNTGNPTLNTVNAASNNITQSGNITVGGTSTFRAVESAANQVGTGNITLNAGGTNTLSGAIQFTGVNVALANVGATNLGAASILGTFSVTTTGNITNSGILDVAGTSSFTGTVAGTTITLNQANLLDGAVSFTKTGGGNVILNNNQATLLGNVTTNGGDFSVTSNGGLTQDVGTAITQNVGGALNVTTAGANSDAVLTNLTNNILALNNATTTGNFQYYDANGYNVTGALAVTGFTELGTVTGNVAQTAGSITTNGLLLRQLNAGAVSSNFSLDQAANNIGLLASSVGNAGSTANIRVVNGSDFAIGTVNGVNGINSTATSTVRLDARGGADVTLTQNATMNGGDLIITAEAGGNLVQNGGVIVNADQLYLRADAVGTLANPILTQNTAGTFTNLSAQSTTGGLFLRNQTSGGLNIVTFDPAGFADPTNNAPSVAGLQSATQIVLENTASGVGNGGIALLGTGVINAGTTVTVLNNGSFTQDNLATRVTGTQLTLQGTGDVGTLANRIISNTPAVIFDKPTSGTVFLTNANSVDVQGTLNGGLLLATSAGSITINAANLNGSGPSNVFELNAAVQIINGGGVIDMNGGDLALFAQNIGSGIDIETRNVGVLEAQASAGSVNINNAYTPGFGLTGNTLTVGDVANLSVSAFAGLQAALGQLTLDQSANNSINIVNTSAVNDVSAASNISIVVAPSGSGPDQLLVQAGAVIRAGAGSGGSITIRGGTNNQGTVAAGLGTTVLLDGGRPDLILGGTQTYTDSVTFEANDDIIVTGVINQNGTNATTSFVADLNNDGAGGFLLFDDGVTGARIVSNGGPSALVAITGSNLIDTNNLAPGFGGSIGNGVVIIKPAGNAIQMGNNGDINLVSKDPLTTGQNNIIVNGDVLTGTGGDINLDSDFGIAMGSNITAGNDVTAQNDGIFIRTAANARISAGNQITFTGLGNLGTDPVASPVANALLTYTSLGDLQTAAGVIDFDSASFTKATSLAFINELNDVGIQGQLDELTIAAGGVINDATNNLILNALTATAGGAINLGNLAHEVSEFRQITANGNITYTGIVDLDISGRVRGSSSSTVSIDITGFDLEQLNANADIQGRTVELFFDEGILRANIEGVDNSAVAQRAVSVTITNSGELVRVGDTSLIRATTLNLEGNGDVGNNHDDGLRTRIVNLNVDKPQGDVYVIQPDTAAEVAAANPDTVPNITVNASIGGAAQANFNLASSVNSIRIGSATGIIADNASNVSLIADSTTGATTITTQGGAINMSGGNLLLVARGGIGTKSNPILTGDTYNLAALNTGTAGGIFIENSLIDGPTADIIISDVADFTSSSRSVTQTFNGVVQASTGNTGATTGARNIRIVNLGDDIRIGDRIQVAQANQNVYLVANEAGGEINQEDADGVINMAGGQLYLQADSGIGDVNNAVRTSGSFFLAAQSTNDSNGGVGGIYLTNVTNNALSGAFQANAASASGTITISSFGETGGGLAVISGVTTQSPGGDADIRIRNAGDSASNIVIDELVQASVFDGANTVALIADNGAILQGGVNGRIVSDTDGVNPGEVLLAASQGIGTLATPLIVQGHYNLAFRNDTLDFTSGAVTGNVNILNNALGPLSSLGHITITNVDDLFTDAGVNVGLAPVVGGLNTADTAASGAIRITNSNAATDAGDIIVISTNVATTGTTTGTAFIELIAQDDVIVGDLAQTLSTNVTTANGAISFTATNENDIANDGDTVDGILIQAGSGANAANDAPVTAQGAAGTVTLTATANEGLLVVNGGGSNGALAQVSSSQLMTVNADRILLTAGDFTNAIASLTSANGQAITAFNTQGAADAIVLQGANGTNARAQIENQNGSQSVTATVGNLALNGGLGDGADARIRATTTSSNQTITVTNGNLLLTAGNNTTDGGNADIVLAGTGNGQQTVTVNGAMAGNITLQAGTGALGQARITSNRTQSVSAANALSLTGGGTDNTTADSLAAINMTGGLGNSQTISAGTTITLLGGLGSNASAFINSNNTQTVTAGTGMSLTGGAGPGGGSEARIVADNTQLITATTGNLTLTGGNGSDATAAIRHLNTNAGVTGGQTINVLNGNLVVTANQDAANDVGEALIQMLVNDTTDVAQQTVNVAQGTITVIGGAGQGEQARIDSNGNQTVTARDGITVQGIQIAATGDTSLARIRQANVNGTQVVTVTGPGNLNVLGGRGNGSAASIESTGTAQTLTVTNGALLVRGDLNADGTDGSSTVAGQNAAAGIIATNTNAVQTVNVTNGGIIVQGGADATEEALIVMSGANGRQTIQALTAGNLSVLGGDGGASSASIVSAGVNGGGANQEAQRIIVANGNLVVDAGNATSGGASAFIDLTNTGSATQFIDVEGTVSVLGGDGGGEPAFIRSAGFNTVNGLAQDINSLNALLIQSGNNGGANASIESTGAFGRHQIVVQTGNLSILAGTGGGNQAFIRAAGDNGATLPGQEAQRIIVSAGNLIIDANSGTGGNQAFIDLTNTTTATQFIDVEGTVSVLGGDGGGEPAFIRSAGFNTVNGLAQDINSLNALLIQSGNAGGANASIESTGAFGRQQIVVQTGNLSILAGTGAGNQAFIRAAGDNGATLPGQEAQRIIVASGSLIIDANSGAGGTQAFIDLTNTTTATQIVDVEGTISVLGGDGGGEQAFIRSAGFNAALGLAQDINALSGMLIQGGDTAGGGNAFIDATGLQGRQLIVVQNNDLEIRGGSGGGQDVRIASAGLNGAGANQEAQRILVLNGDLLLDAGDAVASGTRVAIRQTNTGAATQFIDVEGRIDVLAGDGGGETASITAAGFDAAQGLAQTINALSGLRLEGGNTNGGNSAFIDATGLQGRQLIVVQNNDLEILGGSGAGQDNRIASAGLNGAGVDEEAQRILVLNGDLLLDAGDAADSGTRVAIRQTNTGAATQLIDVDGAAAGTISLTGGAGSGETASITAAGFNAAPGTSQNINALNGMSLNGGLGSGSSALVTASGLQSTQTITVQNNNLSLTGGNGSDADARILAQGLVQTIAVQNGNLLLTANQDAVEGSSDARIQADNNASTQTINVAGVGAGLITLLGGAGTTEIAEILGNGIQSITAANGISITGGSGTGSTALITKAGDAADTQTITVTTGNFDITGGTGENADARVASNGVAQTINVNNGALRVRADQTNAATANADAVITATNAAAVQTLNVTNGGIQVIGGAGATELATISMTGASGRQTINLITDGDLLVEGGDGAGSAALITSAGINGGGTQAQRIIIDAGQLIVRGNQDATNGTGTATISQTSTAANTTQFIQVSGTTGTDGRITVLGGAGDGDFALISSTGRGTPGQQITAATDLTVEGGTGTNATAGITHAASILGGAANGQSITVGGNLVVEGGSGQDASALIQGNRNQTIVVTGNASILADRDGANGGGSAEINQTAFIGTAQNITVNGTGGLTITGGTGDGDFASINKAISTGTQTITVTNAGITLNGGDGLAVQNNFARIRSLATGAQTINWNNGFNLVLNANQGSSDDAAVSATLTNYGAAIASLGVQNIGQSNGGAVLVNGGDDLDAVALIGSALAQNITSRGVITVTAGSADNTSAQIRGLTTQTINSGGLLSVLGSGTAASNNFAVIRSGLAQTITVTAGGLVIDANSSTSAGSEGSSLAGYGAGIVTSGSQLVDVQAGTIQMLGGDVAGAVALIELNSLIPGATNQTVRTSAAGTSINLFDGTGGDAAIISNGTSANGQVITSVTTTNLSGINGNQSLIQGVNTTLNNVGGTWAGQANVVSSIQASINNTGVIVINESSGFTGGVTTPLLRFFGGTATVGATTDGPLGASTRLNTFVDEIFFDGVGAKTVNISETDTVDLRGTIGTVNLLVDNAGDITTNTAALNATNATFQTFDGDINLSGVANNVANFQGVIARDANTDGTGGNFNYLGASNTTVLARQVSAEITAGQDIFATNTITMDVGGNTIFLAGGTKIAGTGPGAGDGTIFSGSGQNYNSAIFLTTDYLITSDGSGTPASDLVNFNSTIDGPGGLGIGSTPNFNANIGDTTPLAYLVLNSTTANFNSGFTQATINGSYINNGTMNTFGDTTFIVDNGTVGPGPGVFTGGTMNLGGAITIYAGAIGSVTGSAVPGTEVFDAWTGSPFTPLVPFATATIFFKAPNPFDPFDPFNKERLVKRKFTIRYDMAYNEGRRPAGYADIAGIPNVPEGKAGGLMSTTYDLDAEVRIEKTEFTDIYKQP